MSRTNLTIHHTSEIEAKNKEIEKIKEHRNAFAHLLEVAFMSYLMRTWIK